jgi:hypothetical protein
MGESPTIIYSHYNFVEECPKEEDALAFVDLWKTMISTLQATNDVYIRVEPQIVMDRRFETDTTSWVARARFSVSLRRH